MWMAKRNASSNQGFLCTPVLLLLPELLPLAMLLRQVSGGCQEGTTCR
jgi:hypothetical protein